MEKRFSKIPLTHEEHNLLRLLAKRKNCPEQKEVDDWAEIRACILKCFICQKEIDVQSDLKNGKINWIKVDEHGKMHLEESNLLSFV